MGLRRNPPPLHYLGAVGSGHQLGLIMTQKGRRRYTEVKGGPSLSSPKDF